MTDTYNGLDDETRTDTYIELGDETRNEEDNRTKRDKQKKTRCRTQPASHRRQGGTEGAMKEVNLPHGEGPARHCSRRRPHIGGTHPQDEVGERAGRGRA